MKTILRLVLGIFLLAGHPAFSTDTDKLRTAAVSLDETYQRADLKKITPRLAALIKADPALVEQALVVRQIKFSAIAIARLVSEKSSRPFATVLTAIGEADGFKAAQEAGISVAELTEYLDNLQPEVAFIMFDFRSAHR